MLRTSASDIDRRTKHLKDENTYLKEQIIEKDNRILRLQSSHDAQKNDWSIPEIPFVAPNNSQILEQSLSQIYEAARVKFAIEGKKEEENACTKLQQMLRESSYPQNGIKPSQQQEFKFLNDSVIRGLKTSPPQPQQIIRSASYSSITPVPNYRLADSNQILKPQQTNIPSLNMGNMVRVKEEPLKIYIDTNSKYPVNPVYGYQNTSPYSTNIREGQVSRVITTNQTSPLMTNAAKYEDSAQYSVSPDHTIKYIPSAKVSTQYPPIISKYQNKENSYSPIERRVETRHVLAPNNPLAQAQIIHTGQQKFYKNLDLNMEPTQSELDKIKADRLNHYHQYSAHENDYISRSRSNSPDEIFNTWN